jgi:hypothetical protein
MQPITSRKLKLKLKLPGCCSRCGAGFAGIGLPAAEQRATGATEYKKWGMTVVDQGRLWVFEGFASAAGPLGSSVAQEIGGPADQKLLPPWAVLGLVGWLVG